MSTTIAPSIQLPDGYAATERIGSGGYGEVWRATAPGGVEKAIKVVFGHCSEDLAERELKSLERIRSVRHPFVLSLERFEIVGGRLVIVTELADMSLDACFRKYQDAGKEGIPRDELIRYLNDAADALDCLVERHSLQHLDIKPENLLVVGDHVKVGDFGLVKELATRTLNSMMGGMTPLYSAPEVFDDSPSPRSDQYSLAIVYQQMLTGQLPFPGRTPAQLAKQHTQAEPNLQSLSEADRNVIKKALAKQPEARFASCRELVAALTAGGIKPTADSRATAGRSLHQTDSDPDETKSIAASNTQPLASSPLSASAAATNAIVRQEPPTPSKPPAYELSYPTVNEDVVDVALPKFKLDGVSSVPTLMVAIGGLGLNMLEGIRRRVGQLSTKELAHDHLAFLAIDTDRESLNAAVSNEGSGRLNSADVLHIPLKRPKQYRNGSQSLLRWVSRRWLYNIPRSLETRGYRPLGRIAAVDHAEPILSNLYSKLHSLTLAKSAARQVRVVLLAGSSGGTGGGILVDVAQAAKSLARDLGVGVEVHSMVGVPERAAGTAESLSIANSYSLLTEIAHVQRFGNVGTSSPSGPAERYEASTAAFDAVYMLSIPPRNVGDGRVRTFESIAEYLALEATSPDAATAIAAARDIQQSDDFRLRSFRCSPLSIDLEPADFLSRSDPYVLNCGFRRASLLLGGDGSQGQKLRALRKTLAICEAPTTAPVLVSEAADIDPLFVAARLAEYYPDIAEAADRLRTRDDIEWQDLRASEPIVRDAVPRPHETQPGDSLPEQATIQR